MKTNSLSFAIVAFFSPMFLWSMQGDLTHIKLKQHIIDENRTYNETEKAKERLARQEYLKYGLKNSPNGYLREQLYFDATCPFDRPIKNFIF